MWEVVVPEVGWRREELRIFSWSQGLTGRQQLGVTREEVVQIGRAHV